MMKKNILAVALLSSALAIGTGVAVAHGMHRATEVRAASQKIGFFNSDGWASVKAHYWKDGVGGGTEWPGDAMAAVGETGVYTMDIDPASYDRVVFNNGLSGGDERKTGDLNISAVAANSVYDFGNSKWAVPHSWGLCGGLNGAAWANEIKTSASTPITGTNATFTVELKENDTFKFRADKAWDLQLSGSDISGQNGTYFSVEDTNAKVKEGKGGTYTFEITWRVENYGDKAYGISVTNYVPTSTSYKMVGKGSLWTGDFVFENGVDMTVVSASEVKAEDVTLAAGDKFKFSNGTKWYGFSNIKTGSPLYAFLEADGDDNIVVKEGKGGVFTFYVDIDIDPDADTSENPEADKAIWVTNDDYVALDTWARGFMVEEDLCNGSGHEWSEYATSYAKLDADVKALFVPGKTAAKEDGDSYIEKAAYRYEYGVAVKGQTAFAEAQRPYDGFKNKYSTALGLFHVEQKTNVTAIIIATVSLGAIAAAAGFVFLRKKRNNA